MDEAEILTSRDFAVAWKVVRNTARRRAQRRAKELGIKTVRARSPSGQDIVAYSKSDGKRIIAAQSKRKQRQTTNLSSKKEKAAETEYQIGTGHRPDVMTVFDIMKLSGGSRPYASSIASRHEKTVGIKRLPAKSDKGHAIIAYRRSDGFRLVQHIIALRIAKATRQEAEKQRKLAREAIPQPKALSSKSEVFYLIKQYPDNNLYKIGWTSNIEQRKKDHRTLCPDLRVIKSWPCKKAQDNEATRYALKFPGAQGKKSETFRTQDLEGFVRYLDNYFKTLDEGHD